MTFSPVRFGGQFIAKYGNFSRIAQREMRIFSALQTVWRRGRDSEPPDSKRLISSNSTVNYDAPQLTDIKVLPTTQQADFTFFSAKQIARNP